MEEHGRLTADYWPNQFINASTQPNRVPISRKNEKVEVKCVSPFRDLITKSM